MIARPVMKEINSSKKTQKQEFFSLTCESAKDIWDKVTSLYKHNSISNKTSLIQKFCACKTEANEGVLSYVTRIENKARTLKDLGEELSKDSVVSKVLASLSSKYDTLITAWDCGEAGKLNIEILRERLFKEEKKLTKQEEEAMALSISIPKKTRI